MSIIQKTIDGIKITFENEGLDDNKNPAKIIIHDKEGNPLWVIHAKKDTMTGADGGLYPCVRFEQI